MSSYTEKKNVVELIKRIYKYAGLSFSIKDDQINEEVIKILYRMIESIRDCSDAMAKVPTPPAGRPGLLWLASNASKIINGLDNTKVNQACIVRVITLYKSHLFIATIR